MFYPVDHAGAQIVCGVARFFGGKFLVNFKGLVHPAGLHQVLRQTLPHADVIGRQFHGFLESIGGMLVILHLLVELG